MKTALDSNVIVALLCLRTGNTGLIELLGKLNLEGALVLCGAAYAEAHAIPGITRLMLDEFLEMAGIAIEGHVSIEDWEAIGEIFEDQAARASSKKSLVGTTLFLSDLLVGCHASHHADRLLTLDPIRYEFAFPKLQFVQLEALTNG